MVMTTGPEFRRGFADYLRAQAESRRQMASENPDEKARHNRASARLLALADYVEKQGEAHVALNELYAWTEASADRPVDYSSWRPSDAQVAAIDRYAERDDTGGEEALLTELASLR
jgi:hypothetical protein